MARASAAWHTRGICRRDDAGADIVVGQDGVHVLAWQGLRHPVHAIAHGTDEEPDQVLQKRNVRPDLGPSRVRAGPECDKGSGRLVGHIV